MRSLYSYDLSLRAESSLLSSNSAADPARVWSRAECETLFHRVVGLTRGGGDTAVRVRLSWHYGLRWARNAPTMSAVARNCRAIILRGDGSGSASIETSTLDDASLTQVVAAAEEKLAVSTRRQEFVSAQQYVNAPIWSDVTFGVAVQSCSDAARIGVDAVRAAGLVAAGYLETRAETWAFFNTKGLAAYAAGTMAQYSETVRNREGTGSGWAGLTHTDWSKIDVPTLSARAMQKCVASANPRAIEPGRYTAILEPQVVGRFFFHMVHLLDRQLSERGGTPFFGKTPGTTRIGERVLDHRITISTDPMDPDCPYMPFDENGYPYRPVTWIENGVLKALAYDIGYARGKLKMDTPLPNPLAYRMSGGETTLEEMIATTARGLLVSNTDIAYPEVNQTNLISTVTRDGLWLIENGKITHPVKNMEIIESPIFIGNRIEQLGRPERIFGTYNHAGPTDTDPATAFGNLAMVVPPMRVRDFNFSALTEAV